MVDNLNGSPLGLCMHIHICKQQSILLAVILNGRLLLVSVHGMIFNGGQF